MESKNKQENKLIEIDVRLACGYQRQRVRGMGNWRKVVKGYKFPVIRQISIRDGMYYTLTIANTAV